MNRINNIREMVNNINQELKDTTNNCLNEKHKMSKITNILGMVESSTEIIIELEASDGSVSNIKFYHEQDCCESVWVDQVDNNVERHIGAYIYAIREKVSCDEEENEDEYSDDSNTWTFYDIETSKGRLSFRWHGASNGYYSESVDINQ